MVMILNGKTMSEISADLEAFIGEPACSDFALRLGEELRNLSLTNEDDGDDNGEGEGAEDDATNEFPNKETNDNNPSTIISLTRKNPATEARLSKGLNASRDGKDKTVSQAPSRLMKNALKSTLVSQGKKRATPREVVQNQPHEQKRQRIVQVSGSGRGYVTNQAHPPSFMQPSILNPQTLVESQAHQFGFGSVEEMMAAYFQQNMFAMMQSMTNSAGFGMLPSFPNYSQGPPMTQQRSHPSGDGSYPSRGRGRGRSPRGTYRGRGFYPNGRGGRGYEAPTTETVPGQAEGTTEQRTSTIFTSAPIDQGTASNAIQSSESLPSDTIVHTPIESAGTGQGGLDSTVQGTAPPFRGGYRGRGRASGRDTFRGRGRFAGRIIRGRNKTWVRGPGTEVPLSTDRT